MGAKSRYRRMYVSSLICPVCRTKTPIVRPLCEPRSTGHIKTMYCFGCKTTRDLVEVGFHGGRLGEEVESLITTVNKPAEEMTASELKAELLRSNMLREILLDENNRHIPLARIIGLAERIEELESELERRTA